MQDTPSQTSASLQLILAAENNRKRYKLTGEITIGRDSGCGIILQSVNISRQHAKISIHEQGALLEDLNSANGTYLNGLKVSGQAPLHLGDLVCFDDQPFRVIAEDVPEALLKQVRAITAEQVAIAPAKLNPEQQSVVRMHTLQELSFRDIARATGKSEVALRKIYERAKAKLRGLVIKDYHHEP